MSGPAGISAVTISELAEKNGSRDERQDNHECRFVVTRIIPPLMARESYLRSASIRLVGGRRRARTLIDLVNVCFEYDDVEGLVVEAEIGLIHH